MLGQVSTPVPTGAVGSGEQPPFKTQQCLRMQPVSGQNRPVTINLLTAGSGGEWWLARSGGGLCLAGSKLPPSSRDGGAGRTPMSSQFPCVCPVVGGTVGGLWLWPFLGSLHLRVHMAVHHWE